MPNSPPKLGVCVPFRSAIPAKCAAALMVAWSDAGDAWKAKYGEGAEAILVASYHAPSVAEARINLAESAIASGCDWVLWLDDDAIAPAGMTAALMETGKDFVAPVFCKKTPPYDVTCYDLTGGKFVEAEVSPPRLFKVDATGMHAALMNVDVLRDVQKYVDAPMFIKSPNMGEDIYFSQLASKVGHEVWVDSRIKVGHFASYVAYPSVEEKEAASV